MARFHLEQVKVGGLVRTRFGLRSFWLRNACALSRYGEIGALWRRFLVVLRIEGGGPGGREAPLQGSFQDFRSGLSCQFLVDDPGAP